MAWLSPNPFLPGESHAPSVKISSGHFVTISDRFSCDETAPKSAHYEALVATGRMLPCLLALDGLERTCYLQEGLYLVAQ